MKSALASLVLLASLMPCSAQVQVTVSKDLDSTPGMNPIYMQEIKLVKTIQNKDFSAYKAYLLPDFLLVTNTLQNADQYINSIKKCDFGMWGLQNYQVRVINAEAAVINYRLHSVISCGKQSRGGDFNATTIWVLHDKKWLAQIHTETPIPSSE